MKKIGLLFATIIMMLLFAVSASATTEGYYTYEVENGEATITGIDESISGDVVIPDTLGGYSVTSIGEYAFLECRSLTSITIPDSVTSIGDGAFLGCISLTSITVDTGNKYYSSDSYGVLFDKNKNTLIQYPVGNTRTTYTIPDSVTSIGEGAFSYCRNLASITIPDSVTSIGDHAFDDCRNLTSITIPDSVTSIGYRAFYYCTNLTDVYYIGSQSQWDEIEIDSGNDCLLDANIHFGSCSANSNGKHSYTAEIITPATHLTEGVQTLTCACGDSHTETIAVIPHSYTSKITTQPTHLKEGVKTFTCACGDSYTEVVAKTKEHNYNAVSNVVAPTCEDKGYTVYVCECGSSKKDNYTSATGHKYDGQICVKCGENCSCNCHKTGISNFFWKIANFFNKLFKIKGKQMCACGVAHF